MIPGGIVVWQIIDFILKNAAPGTGRLAPDRRLLAKDLLPVDEHPPVRQHKSLPVRCADLAKIADDAGRIRFKRAGTRPHARYEAVARIDEPAVGGDDRFQFLDRRRHEKRIGRMSAVPGVGGLDGRQQTEEGEQHAHAGPTASGGGWFLGGGGFGDHDALIIGFSENSLSLKRSGRKTIGQSGFTRG